MRFDQFDLNLLRVFNVLLIERNVTRAANRLGVTQQAVSNSLKKLRDTFGDPLFVRVGHSMQPTPFAASLAAPLHETLWQLERTLRHQPTFDPATTSRNFRVALPHYLSFAVLPRALRMLANQAPMINLQVQSPSPGDIAALDRGDLDLLATDDAVRASPSWQCETILRDDFVCLIDRAWDGVLDLDHYAAMPHCVLRTGPDDRMQVERSWQTLGMAPRVAAVAPGYAVLALTLPGTELLATVPRRIAHAFCAALGLRTHACPIPVDPLRGDLYWHRRNDADPAHAYMISILRHAASVDAVTD